MKKIVFLSFLIISIHVFAQKHHQKHHMKGSTEQRADTISQRMKKSLGLTEDQAKKSKEINLRMTQSLKEVHLKYKEMMKNDLKKIETATDSQYKLLLTSEQYSKYLNLKDRKKHKHKHKMKMK